MSKPLITRIYVRTLCRHPRRSLATAAVTNTQAIPILSDITSTQPQTSRSSRLHRPETHNPDAPRDSADYFYTATISRTGTMAKTVQLTIQNQTYDKFLRKHYTRPLRFKAHDPNPAGFLREGDVVQYSRFTAGEKEEKAEKEQNRIARTETWLIGKDASGKRLRAFQRVEKKKAELSKGKPPGVKFVVRRVVTPFGMPLEQRLVPEDGEEILASKDGEKVVRSAAGPVGGLEPAQDNGKRKGKRGGKVVGKTER